MRRAMTLVLGIATMSLCVTGGAVGKGFRKSTITGPRLDKPITLTDDDANNLLGLTGAFGYTVRRRVIRLAHVTS